MPDNKKRKAKETFTQDTRKISALRSAILEKKSETDNDTAHNNDKRNHTAVLTRTLILSLQ